MANSSNKPWQTGLAVAHPASQAIDIFEHVLHIREEKLAADHPDRLASQHELARAYLEDGRMAEAINSFEYVVRMKSKLRANHRERLISQHELARAYWLDQRLAEADDLMSYVVDVRQRTLREDHPERIGSEEGLAMIREDPRNPAGVSKVFTASDIRQDGDTHEDDMPSNH